MKRLLLALTCVAMLSACNGKGTSGGSVGTDQNGVPAPSNSPAATQPVPAAS